MNKLLKYQYQSWALIVLVAYLGSFYAGRTLGRRQMQAEITNLQMEYVQQAAAASSAHAAALQQANAALLLQRQKSAEVSRQLAAANTATKTKTNQLKKEVMNHEQIKSSACLDADGMHIYNAAFGY